MTEMLVIPAHASLSVQPMNIGDILAWVALITTFPIGTIKIWKGIEKDDKFVFLEGLINVTFCCGAASWIAFANPWMTVAVTVILLALSPLISWVRNSIPAGDFICVFPVQAKHVEAANDIAKESWGTQALSLTQIMPLFEHNSLTTVVMCNDTGQVVGYFDIFPMRESDHECLVCADMGERDIIPEHLLTTEELLSSTSTVKRLQFGGIATRKNIRGKTVMQDVLLLWMLLYLKRLYFEDAPGAEPKAKQLFLSILPHHSSEHLVARTLLKLTKQTGNHRPRPEGIPLYSGWVTSSDLNRAIEAQQRRLHRIFLFRAFEHFDATALNLERLSATFKGLFAAKKAINESANQRLESDEQPHGQILQHIP